jgi:hypothetical protein
VHALASLLSADREPSRFAALTKAGERPKVQHPRPFAPAANRDGSRSGEAEATLPGRAFWALKRGNWAPRREYTRPVPPLRLAIVRQDSIVPPES